MKNQQLNGLYTGGEGMSELGNGDVLTRYQTHGYLAQLRVLSAHR